MINRTDEGYLYNGLLLAVILENQIEVGILSVMLDYLLHLSDLAVVIVCEYSRELCLERGLPFPPNHDSGETS